MMIFMLRIWIKLAPAFFLHWSTILTCMVQLLDMGVCCGELELIFRSMVNGLRGDVGG